MTISRLIRLTFLLSADPNETDLLKGNTPNFSWNWSWVSSRGKNAKMSFFCKMRQVMTRKEACTTPVYAWRCLGCYSHTYTKTVHTVCTYVPCSGAIRLQLFVGLMAPGIIASRPIVYML